MNGEQTQKEVITTDPVTVVDRLNMRYPIGPMVNGEPEFGWRDMSGPAPEGCVLPTPLMLEAAAEIDTLRSILSEAAPAGIEKNCDECAGDNDKCFEGCWVRRARKAGINADTDEPMEWV